MSGLTHLDELEAEAIYIIREVAAECEKPVMLYSIGKDSSVMLHLAMKAFYPEKPPFPFLHVNTTWKFREMIEFRDKTAKELGIEMLEYINEEGVKQGINPFDHGAAYTDIMKTQALKQALNKYGFTAAFGGGDVYSQKGWTLTFIVLMIVFVILNMFTFFMCKERVVEGGSDQKEAKENRVSFIKGLKGLFVNKYWVLLVIAIFAMYFMMSCFFGSAVFFAQYNVGNAGKYAIISNCLSMAQIAFLFVTPFIMKKVSKKNLFMCGIAVSGIGFLLSGFTTNVTATSVLSVVKGMGFACAGATMFGLLQDAITYGEWYNGYGTAGMGNAASSFCMKVGSGIGTAALGWVLGFGQFDAKKTVQSAKALAAINWSFAWIPFIMVVIVVVCMIFFDLDKKYDQVIADLEQGKHRNDQ